MKIKNRLQLAFEYVPECDNLLDIGCDYGDFASEYMKKAKKVYAIDPNVDVIDAAKKKHPSIIFEIAPAEKIPFPDSCFDVVAITDAFEHVDDEKKTMDEIYRVVKPGGILVFSVPYKGLFGFLDSFNMKFYFPRVYKFWKGKRFDPEVYKKAPWHRHYSLKDLKRFFDGKFIIEKKHRGGLFLYAFLWIFDNAFFRYDPLR